MKFYSDPLPRVMSHLNTDESMGLSEELIKKRRLEFGENALKAKKHRSLARKFLDQFRDVMILILIAAAIISFAVALHSGDSREFFEPALILAIVVLNAVMGVAQESKAEKALDALKDMTAQTARVIRGGREQMIDAKELVPGDIILIEAGDFIPADARLINSASLKSEESALTGESVPSEKYADSQVAEDAPIGDRYSMVHSGCSITYGRAKAVITGTGMNTEMGRIANLLEQAEDAQTPLQQKLSQLGKYLGIVAVAACAVIFAIGAANNIPLLEIFMISVSLAVSAIPEGLPAIVTVILSIGVQRMVKKNAIIRRLPAVETLGSASVICSDKTGTLTQNRMTLTKAYVQSAPGMEDIGSQNSAETKELLKYAALCCDGSIEVSGDDIRHIGDPTETAIIYAAYINGMEKQDLAQRYPRLGEIPFDSDRKLMTTVCDLGGKITVIVKGALESLAPLCVSGDMKAAEDMTLNMSEQALRVLAVGYKVLDSVPEVMDEKTLENGLAFMGIMGMIDPPRPEVRDAVAVCREAGIRPVMITGDHVITAQAIAKDLGIMDENDAAVTGAELARMKGGELDERVKEISVYARVSPEDKIRIVQAWQKQGQVVAMTGDGVNDAPALKAADIGCAMGITGTDVAKNASDMTLTDDNFTTIVDAVREGRGIYENIRKVVGFLLGTNVGEILSVFLAMILWRRSPLLSMHLLLINLVTDSLPAIALGMEEVEPGIMKRRPRPRNEGIFAHGFALRIVLQGIMFGLLTLIAYSIGESMAGIAGGQTMAFIVLAVSQIVQAFNMRSERSLFSIGPFSNKNLNLAALASTLVVLIVLFIPPVALVFGLIRLPLAGYLIALGLSLVPFPAMELAKALKLIRHKEH